MPLYEYRCLDCEKIFTVALSLSERDRVVVQCPGCGSKKAQQLISPFIAMTVKKT